MSDTHMWATQGHAQSLSAQEVGLEVAATAVKVAAVVHLFKGDANEAVRSWLLVVVGGLDDLSKSVKSGAVTPVAEAPEPRRVVGERTRDGIRRLSKNRGHL